jgi:septum formation protein
MSRHPESNPSEHRHDGASRGLILASASPRRQQLLTEAGYRFEVDPAEIDESAYPQSLTPTQVAEHLAREKARAVAERHPADVVLAADTIVTFGDRVLGKPLDATDARRMLTLLSGTTHIVITGVAIAQGSSRRAARALRAVRMRALSPG